MQRFAHVEHSDEVPNHNSSPKFVTKNTSLLGYDQVKPDSSERTYLKVERRAWAWNRLVHLARLQLLLNSSRSDPRVLKQIWLLPSNIKQRRTRPIKSMSIQVNSIEIGHSRSELIFLRFSLWYVKAKLFEKLQLFLVIDLSSSLFLKSATQTTLAILNLHPLLERLLFHYCCLPVGSPLSINWIVDQNRLSTPDLVCPCL